jgi:hypothetical protein
MTLRISEEVEQAIAIVNCMEWIDAVIVGSLRVK